MGVGGGDHVRLRLVDRGMDDEGGLVGRLTALDDLAMLVDQLQVGDADLAATGTAS